MLVGIVSAGTGLQLVDRCSWSFVVCFVPSSMAGERGWLRHMEDGVWRGFEAFGG